MDNGSGFALMDCGWGAGLPYGRHVSSPTAKRSIVQQRSGRFVPKEAIPTSALLSRPVFHSPTSAMPNVTLDRPNAAEFRLTVELTAEDYQTRAKAELKRLARGAKIKGFRPGKVPAAFMKKQYGKGVVLESISKAIDEALQAAVKEHELDLFGQLESAEEPDMAGVNADYSEPLTFVFEGGVLPSLEAVDTTPLKDVSRFSVQLTDEEADERITEASKRFLDYADLDAVETEDDFATLVVSDAALDAKFYGEAGAAHSAEPTTGNDAKDGADAETHEHDAEEAASAKTEDADADETAEQDEDPRQKFFLRAVEMEEEQRYKLIDKAIGTEVILALDDLREDVRERFAKAIDAEGTTTFTIAKVDREQAPELNEETYAKIFGAEAGVTTQEEAREAFAKRFREASQSNLDEFALEHVIDALETANPLDVPAKAIKQRLEQARKEEREKAAEEGRAPEYDHELTEADRHGLGRRLKWMAYRKALVEQLDVELEAADIDAAVEAEYRQQLGGMGVDPDQFREQFFETFKTNLLQNRERMIELTDGLVTAKLLDKMEADGLLGARKELSEADFSQTVEAYNGRVAAELEELRGQKL